MRRSRERAGCCPAPRCPRSHQLRRAGAARTVRGDCRRRRGTGSARVGSTHAGSPVAARSSCSARRRRGRRTTSRRQTRRRPWTCRRDRPAPRTPAARRAEDKSRSSHTPVREWGRVVRMAAGDNRLLPLRRRLRVRPRLRRAERHLRVACAGRYGRRQGQSSIRGGTECARRRQDCCRARVIHAPASGRVGRAGKFDGLDVNVRAETDAS